MLGEETTVPILCYYDNENKIKVAFDLRWETANCNFGGRIGCTEHVMATCLTYELDVEPKLHCSLELMDQLINKLNKKKKLLKISIIAVIIKQENWLERYQRSPPLVHGISNTTDC